MKYQAIIDGDKNLRGYGLRVEEAGPVVRIQGVVDTLAEKKHALALLSQAGARVEDGISISTDGGIKTSHLQHEVEEEMAREVDLRHIGAEIDRGGMVTLVGDASPEEVEKAKQAAQKARGVTGVQTRMTNEENTWDLVREVRRNLVDDPQLGDQPIAVSAREGTICLDGSVQEDGLIARAVQLAHQVHGVQDVEVHLQVDSEMEL